MQKYLRISKKSSTFAPAFREKLRGAIAQLVEQRTENPCVPGSIPGGTTVKKRSIRVSFLCLREYKPGVSAAGTIISDETDEERTCLLGGGAGRSPIDRVFGLSIDRKGLFYLLTLERIGFVSSEEEDFDFLMPFRS